MNKDITVNLTESQAYMLIGVLETAIYNDNNDQTKAFKQRVLTKLAQSVVTEQAKS